MMLPIRLGFFCFCSGCFKNGSSKVDTMYYIRKRANIQAVFEREKKKPRTGLFIRI